LLFGTVATSRTRPLSESRTWPAVGFKARRMQREVVVFPQPLSPTSDSVSPRLTKKLTSSTAFTWPTVFWRSPLRMGKYFLSPLTSRSTDASGTALPVFTAAAVIGRENSLLFVRRRHPAGAG